MDHMTFGRTGLQLSRLALGTGNFGTGWGYGADPETAVAILDAYAAAGGNFIDSADVYQFASRKKFWARRWRGGARISCSRPSSPMGLRQTPIGW
ncbi:MULTISPECIES: aldo/keto reductase [Agrobacterium tumefaciens complex]|uniref:NADP-dependent oxidoreductase domain-containing protein n=1 Tax=Agrobacterium tumefaciens str. B6 TaxID=1183423 RepID=A0A822VBP0_AGRTU|nr:aldo/keto reductase [Agrobacterium tumefaciens]CVI24740.1 hypothetical protein AGR4A_pAt10274 [Agrobacterium tumefaciens str. B6]SPZ48443.1 norsolorinic acid reductase [Agrobacterium tumefaciens]